MWLKRLKVVLMPTVRLKTYDLSDEQVSRMIYMKA
jgi:hypothetical protein